MSNKTYQWRGNRPAMEARFLELNRLVEKREMTPEEVAEIDELKAGLMDIVERVGTINWNAGRSLWWSVRHRFRFGSFRIPP